MWKMFAHTHSLLIEDMAWGKDSYRKFTLEVPLLRFGTLFYTDYFAISSSLQASDAQAIN